MRDWAVCTIGTTARLEINRFEKACAFHPYGSQCRLIPTRRRDLAAAKTATPGGWPHLRIRCCRLLHAVFLRQESAALQVSMLPSSLRSSCPPGFRTGSQRVPSATSGVRNQVGRAGLPPDLPQVVSESIFDIPGFVEAALHQRFDSTLCCRSPERSDARIPPRAEFDIRRQCGVDEALGLGDRPFIELGDPRRERLYEHIELGVGQGAINVTVSLGLVRSDVFRAQEHFEGAVSTDQSGKPSHGAASGDHLPRPPPIAR